MNKVDLIDKIREDIKLQLRLKTSWGRNEVMSLVDQAINRIIILHAKEEK